MTHQREQYHNGRQRAAERAMRAGGSEARRRSATEQHQRAIEAINAVFDRVADLGDARTRIASAASAVAGDDPLRDAEAIVQACEQLRLALDAVRSAALAAAEHRSRAELAADVGTKVATLFPRRAGPQRSRGDGPARPSMRAHETGNVSGPADDGVPSSDAG